MARAEYTRTHLENLAIIPKASHGDVTGDPVFAIYAIDANPNSPGDPVFSIDTVGDFAIDATNIVAGGAWGIASTITQDDSIALTGTLRGAYIQAINGHTAATGVIRGVEVKAKGHSGGGAIATLTGGYFNADSKGCTVTTMRGLEVSMDQSGGTATEAVGIEIMNNSSGTQTAGYAVSINGGTATNHKAWTADIRLQNGALIDNTSTSLLNITEATVRITGIADVTGATTLGSTLAVTGAITGLRKLNTVISGASATLAVATTPSGSVIPCTAATVALTLPAVATSAGVHYRVLMAGATQMTFTGATACVLSDGTAVKTNVVYTTTVLNSWYELECDGTNWFVHAKAAPDSSS
jgi:hypothetical protein